MVFILSKLAFLAASWLLSTFTANKLSCSLTSCFVFLSLLTSLLAKLLNSSSVNNWANASLSGSTNFSFSKSNFIGTSVRMVARNFDMRISSTWSSTFFFSAPFSSSVLLRSSSTVPNWLMSLDAVFSPTPGQPGKLSAESPISANRSITWIGEGMPYFSSTSFSVS